MNKQKMIEWIVTHEIGTSSRTMWAGLMEVTSQPICPWLSFDIPYDCDDFSRCYDLVKFCEVNPEEDFPKIVNTFPWYEPILRNWDELVAKYGECNYLGVYNLLHELRKECFLIRVRKERLWTERN